MIGELRAVSSLKYFGCSSSEDGGLQEDVEMREGYLAQ